MVTEVFPGKFLVTFNVLGKRCGMGFAVQSDLFSDIGLAIR